MRTKIRHCRFPSAGRARAIVFAAGAILLICGCSRNVNRLEITSFKDPAHPRKFQQRFEEAYFGRRGSHGFDIVLQSRLPSQAAPTQSILQVVHIRPFWVPKPGETWADDSTVSAIVCYYVLHSGTGMCYEGGGYADLKLERRGRRLAGRLGVVQAKPGRHFGPRKDPFGPIQLSGRFEARWDEAQTGGIIRELMQQFGPFAEVAPDQYPKPVR